MKTRLFASALFIVFVSIASANAAITGTPIGDPAHPLWTPATTNALNYAKQTPGYLDKLTPFVILDSTGPGSVTLNFNSGFAGGSYFEVRLDDVDTGANAHPVVLGDTIHNGVYLTNPNMANVLQTFNALSTVDVRLALGGERDWDFNWTRFEVGSAAVPEPTTLIIWSLLGALGIATTWWRKRAA